MPTEKWFSAPGRVAGLMSVLVLSACGGGGFIDGEEIGKAYADALTEGVVCAFSNCKESPDLALSDISAKFYVTQKDGMVQVGASLGQSANLVTTVRPAGADKITATVNGQNLNLADDSKGLRLHYSGQMRESSAQPVVTVSFQRGNDSYPATVTLPPEFSLISPASPLNLTRSAGVMTVQFNRSVSGTVSAVFNASCQRTDNSNFTASSSVPHSVVSDTYQVSTAELDKALTILSRAANNQKPDTPLVTTCTLDFSWKNEVTGIVSSSLNKYSIIQGLRSVTHRVNYNSRA